MSEADGTKRVRGQLPSGGCPAKADPGARPKRKRGWYRAEERGVDWAVRWAKKGFFDKWLEFFYYEPMKREVLKTDFLLNKIEKDCSWVGGSLIVPIKYRK